MTATQEEPAVMLSKWWRTKSAKAAMRRAETATQARIRALRESKAAKAAELQRQLQEVDL